MIILIQSNRRRPNGKPPRRRKRPNVEHNVKVVAIPTPARSDVTNVARRRIY
jgi:hypothetical protein